MRLLPNRTEEGRESNRQALVMQAGISQWGGEQTFDVKTWPRLLLYTHVTYQPRKIRIDFVGLGRDRQLLEWLSLLSVISSLP